MSRTQHILLLVGIPLVIAVGFMAASGNGLAVMLCVFALPNGGAGFAGWALHHALVTGMMHTRGGDVYRAIEPGQYWFCFAVLTFFALLLIASAIAVDFLMLRSLF